MEYKTQNSLPDTKGRGEFLLYFCEEYKDCDTMTLGRSILGRDIDLYRIGRGGDNIVYVGAHHGAEYITTSVLFDFILSMAEKTTRPTVSYGVDFQILLQKFTFWIIPCLNPDGVELSLHGIEDTPLRARQMRMNPTGDFTRWQANSRGVDLNHNYDFGFLQYKEIEARENITAGPTRYSGEYPESEPETRSLASLVRTLHPELVVSLHTQGEEIYASPKTPRVNRIAKIASRYLGYTICEAEGHAAFGGLCDYTGGVLGIPSLTLELGRGENPLPYEELKTLSSRVLPLLSLLPTYL